MYMNLKILHTESPRLLYVYTFTHYNTLARRHRLSRRDLPQVNPDTHSMHTHNITILHRSHNTYTYDVTHSRVFSTILALIAPAS